MRPTEVAGSARAVETRAVETAMVKLNHGEGEPIWRWATCLRMLEDLGATSLVGWRSFPPPPLLRKVRWLQR